MIVGSKVAPKSWTKDNLTYGYVRERLADGDVWVYWPEIKSSGRWPVSSLILRQHGSNRRAAKKV